MKGKEVRTLLIAGQFILCSILILLVGFFGWEFILHYNLKYNEMRRYFDEEQSVVYHEQAILPYGFLFVVSSALLMSMSWWTFKTLRGKSTEHKVGK